MIHIGVRAEDVTRIELAVLVQIQAVVPDELAKIGTAQVLLLFTKSIVHVKAIHAELVRHQDYPVVRHAARHPVMTSDRLQPPDFVLIIEGDTVRFIGSILLQQRGEPLHAFTGGMDIREDQHDDVFLADPA